MLRRNLMVCGATAAFFVVAGGSHAQENADAGIKNGDAGPGMLEEIVVTARKVRESVQTVPIAISAMSGDQMLRQGVQSVADIQYTVPSLVFSQTATSSFSPLVSLRGQTQGTIAISVDPSVGVYFDGVYLPGTTGLMSDMLLDIDRVEVLKGPQGTLFGRNTTGGAISINTKAPTGSVEGQATIGIGDYGRRIASGVINVPLVANKVNMRLVAGISERDGYGEDIGRKVNVGDQNLSSVRGALALTPIEGLEIVLRGDWTKGKDNGLLIHPRYIVTDPTLSIVRDAAIGKFGADNAANRLAAIAAYQKEAASDPFSVSYNTAGYNKVEVGGGSITASYDFGSAQLKSITSLRSTDDNRLYDVDASELSSFDSKTDISIRQFSQELQVTGSLADSRLKYAAGLYYYDFDGSESSLGTQFGYLTNGGYQLTAADVKTKSVAGYGQVTYALTSAINLTGGLRYTDEERSVNALGGAGANQAAAFVCQLPAALNPDLAKCRALVKVSGDNLSYTAAADWTLSPGVMLYFRTARGYKSGTVNQRIIGSNPLAGNKVLPEDVTDYEIGFKSDWLGRRFRVNADLYQSDYNNIQRSSVVCAPGCTSVFQNAANATIKGAELETSLIPFDGALLGATAAYTYPDYQKYVSGGLDNSREKFLEVPRWTYSINAGYTHPMAFGDLSGNIGWSWRSAMDMAPQDYPGGIRVVGGVPQANGPGTPDAYRIQSAYGLLNASLTLHIDAWGADLRAYSNNLLDKRYFSHMLGNANSLGIAVATPGAPRTFGLDLTVHF